MTILLSEVFSATGPLATAVPGYRLRSQQLELELLTSLRHEVAHVVERTLGAADEGLTAEVLGAPQHERTRQFLGHLRNAYPGSDKS